MVTRELRKQLCVNGCKQVQDNVDDVCMLYLILEFFGCLITLHRRKNLFAKEKILLHKHLTMASFSFSSISSGGGGGGGNFSFSAPAQAQQQDQTKTVSSFFFALA